TLPTEECAMTRSTIAGVLSGVALSTMALATPGHAADLVQSEPEAISSWTGFYVGVVGGFGSGESDADWIGTGTQTGLNGYGFSIDVDGPLIGGQIGADYDLGNGFVLGAVADI